MSEGLSLATLQQAGFITSGDAHFARLGAGGDAEDVRGDAELLIATVSRFLGQGHPCVPLEAIGNLQVTNDDSVVMGELPSTARLKAVAQESLAVSSSGSPETTPLILDDEERLYVARYFEHERLLAAALARLSTAEGEPPPADWLGKRLDHYFPPDGSGEEDLQRHAAATALASPLTVISGGPGTGKTSTVVKILALLFEDAQRRGERVPRVRLLAPTGKAAARMMEATNEAFGRLSVPEALPQSIEEASTIHRALGVIPDNATRFRRGPTHPLRADVVLVDEASMVDLALMRHLLEALHPDARLILLGDRHQLASVEAGSVLSELCTELSASESNESTVELKRSYRFAEDSGIAAFAQSVREGDAPKSLRVLGAGGSDLVHHPSPEDPWGSTALRELTVARYGEALRLTEPSAVLRELSRFRVLCAHRRGRFGVENVNEAISHWLSHAGLIPAGGSAVHAWGKDFYRGRLVLVTENDYGVGLFNGDVGLVWPGGSGRLSVFFEGDNGALRELSPAKLPAHETAYALTIHKSQGSEHEEVAVVLPEAHSPLLTRELLYTGVTRAKKRVFLFSRPGAIEAAVERSVTRHSGLSAALSRALTTEKR